MDANTANYAYVLIRFENLNEIVQTLPFYEIQILEASLSQFIFQSLEDNFSSLNLTDNECFLRIRNAPNTQAILQKLTKIKRLLEHSIALHPLKFEVSIAIYLKNDGISAEEAQPFLQNVLDLAKPKDKAEVIRVEKLAEYFTQKKSSSPKSSENYKFRQF